MKKLTKEINAPTTGDPVVFGSRPGMGLNQIMFRLANEIAKRQNVYYIKPIVTAFGKKELSDIRKKYLKIGYSVAKEEDKMLFQIESLCHSNQYQWLIIEDLSLIWLSLLEFYKEDRAKLILSLKKLTLNYKIRIIITTTLSEDIEIRDGDRKPTLADFNWSVNLNVLVDSLYGVYVPGVYGFNEDESGNKIDDLVEINCLKHQNKLSDQFYLYGNPFEGLREEKI